MSDLGTMEQDISGTLQSLVSTEKIRHRILASVRFHREKRYFFSERKFRFRLSAGRYEYRPGDGYGLPGDLVEIIGETLYFFPNGSTQAYPVQRVGRQEMAWDRVLEAGSQGEPEIWDWFDNALRLSPIPDDADELEGPYVRDLGVPRKKYNTGTSAWEFTTPDGAQTLSTDFTNHWFDALGGYDLVKHRAMHLVYKEVLHNDVMAQGELQTWLEERNRLEDETEGKAGPAAIMPRLW